MVKASPQADIVRVNELAAELVRAQAADLIAGLSNTRKEVVRRVIARGMREGWTDTTLRARISQVVGLDPRRAQAVENYRAAQLRAGVPPWRAERQARAYAKRLTKARVALIADNEMRAALMAAQRLAWREMQDAGDFSTYAVRITRVHRPKDGKTCSVCRPQNGRRRSLWADIHEGPPFHPNCRCDEEVEDRGVAKREDDDVIEKAISPGGRPADASPLAKPGSDGPRRLVNYVRMVAHALMRKGMEKGHAIAVARNTLKRWAAGGGDVSPKVQAAAAKALAEQAALDAKRSVSKAERSVVDLEVWAQMHPLIDAVVVSKVATFPKSAFHSASDGQKCSRWGCGRPATKSRTVGGSELGACSMHYREMTP